MQKFIITIFLLFMGWTSLFAEEEAISRTNVPLNHQEKPVKNHPRAPARIPVVCSHNEYSVFVESLYALFANITVEDESGSKVADMATMISPDLSLTLPIDQSGSFEITIQIDDSTYTGSFTL